MADPDALPASSLLEELSPHAAVRSTEAAADAARAVCQRVRVFTRYVPTCRAGPTAWLDLAAAQKVVEPLEKAPTTFPFTTPLAKRPPAGSVVAYLDAGTPTAAAIFQYLSEAGKELGVTVNRVQTGQSPQTINAALNSVVESKPAAVIDIGLDPALFTPQLEKLRKAGTAFVPLGIVNGDTFGLDDTQIQSGAKAAVDNGKLLASAILAKTEGKATELAFYRVPELSFSPLEEKGVKEQLEAQCPACQLRVVDIPITQIGSTAAQTIVSDLQAHPKTKAVVAAVDDLQMGLPQAEKVAGIDVPGIGISTNPVNLQQIKEGGQLAGYATDLHFVSWTLMDQAAREITGQDFDYSALTSGPTPATNQVITKDNVPADLAAGYIAFPDYKEKFSALWAGK